MFPPNAKSQEEASIDPVQCQLNDRVMEKLKKIDKERAEKRLHSSLSFLADSHSAFGKILEEATSMSHIQQPSTTQSKENIPNNSKDVIVCNCKLSLSQEETIQKLSNELLIVREELEQRKKSDSMSKELFQQSLKMSLDKSVASYFELEGKLLESNRQLRVILDEKEAIFELYEKEKQISDSLGKRIDDLLRVNENVLEIEQQNVVLLDENLLLRQELLFMKAAMTKIPNEQDEFYECNQNDDLNSNPFCTPNRLTMNFPEVEDVTDQIDSSVPFFTPKTSYKPRQTGRDFDLDASPNNNLDTPIHTPYNKQFFTSPLQLNDMTPFVSPIPFTESTKKKVSFNDVHDVKILERNSLLSEEMPLEVATYESLRGEIKRLQMELLEKNQIIKALNENAKNADSNDQTEFVDICSGVENKKDSEITTDATDKDSVIATGAADTDSVIGTESTKDLNLIDSEKKIDTASSSNALEIQLKDKSNKLTNILGYLEIKNEIESELMKFAEKFVDFFDAVDMERMNLIKKHQDTCRLKIKTTNGMTEASERIVDFLVESLRGKIALLEMENLRLIEQINSVPFLQAQHQNSNASLDTLVDTVNTLRIDEQSIISEYEELQQKYSSLSNEFMDLQAIILENDQIVLLLKDQIVMLQQQVSDSQETMLKKEVKITELEIKASQNQFTQAQLLTTNKRLNEEISSLKDENSKLNDQILLVSSEKENFENQFATLKSENIKLKNDNLQLENDVAQQILTVTDENIILKAKIQAQKEAMEESKDNLKIIEMYESKIEQLEQVFDICDNFENENNQLQNEIKLLQNEKEELQLNLNSQDETVKMLQLRIDELDKSAESMTKEKTQLLEEIATLKEGNCSLVEKIKSFDNLILQLTQEIELLREAVKLNEIELLKGEVEELKHSKYLLNSEIDNLQETNRAELIEKEKLSGQVSVLLSEKVSLEANFSRLVSEFEQSKQELEQFSFDNLQLHRDLNDFSILNAELESKIDLLTSTNDELSSLNGQLNCQLESQISQFQSQLQTASNSSVKTLQLKNTFEFVKLLLQKYSFSLHNDFNIFVNQLRNKLVVMEQRLSFITSQNINAFLMLINHIERVKAENNRLSNQPSSREDEDLVLNYESMQNNYTQLSERLEQLEKENRMLLERLAHFENEKTLFGNYSNSEQPFANNNPSPSVDEATFAYEQALDRIQDDAERRLQLKETEIQSLSETAQIVREQCEKQKEQFKRYKMTKDKQVAALKVEITSMRRSILTLKESLTRVGDKVTHYRQKRTTDKRRIKDLIFQKTYLCSIAREYRECEKTMARIINGVSKTAQNSTRKNFNTLRSLSFLVLAVVKFKRIVGK